MQNETVWNHISSLRPSLRAHVHLYPQDYRGERWYILHDQSSGQYLRFNATAYSVLGYLEGEFTIDEIYEYVGTKNNKDAITKDEIVTLIAQLNAAELLKNALPINVQDAFKQYTETKRKNMRRRIFNPLSIKIPLLDPDNFLSALSGLARFIFSKNSLIFGTMIIFFAVLLAISNFDLLLNDLSQIEFAPSQLIALWLTYPIIKFFHELGHGLAIKSFGGEVHEIGINLLFFMPVPYVDATESWSFRSKHRRIIVGAAGIFTELFIAALSLFLYLNIEPGLIQQIALNCIIIATLSTLLFNGNPLLRYDGYFVLEDWLEIPNLGTRAKNYYYYLFQRYLLNITQSRNPVTANGEEKWFILYGFLSPLYRISILFGITLYLVDNYLMLGIVLAIWVSMTQIVVPLIKVLKFLISNPNMQNRAKRKRSLFLIVGSILIIFLILSIPMPVYTYLNGVVLNNNGSQVTAKTSGFILKPNFNINQNIEKGQLLFELEDLELLSKKEGLEARLKELKIHFIFEQRKSRVNAEIIKNDVNLIKKELSLLNGEIADLKVYSPNAGKFVFQDSKDPEGRFIKKGDIIGYIVNKDDLILKVAIDQSRIGLLETYDTTASFILAQQLNTEYNSQIIRKTPQSTLNLPSSVLSTYGGGNLVFNPNDETGKHLIQAVFLIDLSIPQNADIKTIGGRAYVRLNHGYLSLSNQVSLYLNQLFLRHFYAKD